MNTPSTESRGLLASASQLGATILALAENKCVLFANEWETERLWQWRMALRMMLAGMAFSFACLFAAGWLVLMLWDWNHALAVLTPGALFAAIGVALWRSSGILRASKPPAFEMTREELHKDQTVLRAFTRVQHD